MWDLDTLQYLNDRAVLNARKMVNGETSQATPTPETPPVFPLSILASKLIAGPPSIARLIDIMDDPDSIVYFLELVREYLPENEGEIMSEIDDANRIERFCHYFNNRYFPLSDEPSTYDDFTIGDFARQIPVDLMGFNGDDYEQFNDFRHGFILLLSMTESPFVEDERVPILDRVKELVGRSLVELIPPAGWSLGDIHSIFDGSEYEGCASFADWIHGDTGCWQLDANYADYGPEEWSTEIVHGLTRQWPMVIEIQNKMHKMYEWLEEDLYHNFEKLLAKMLATEVESIPKEQIPLPLDEDGQVIKEERR